MIEAAIFDLDGVLVDSYQAHFESWAALALEHGMVLGEAQFAETFGRTSRDIIRELWPAGHQRHLRPRQTPRGSRAPLGGREAGAAPRPRQRRQRVLQTIR